MSILSKQQVKDLIETNNITSVQGITLALKDMFKDVLQEMLEAELENQLGYGKFDRKTKSIGNCRNGYGQKTIKSEFGNVELNIPRDRNGEFEPKIIDKYQRNVSGIEEKVLSLYGRGMSTRDIHDQINDIYGVEISAELVSKITDRIIPDIKEWQNRALKEIYPFIFLDAIHYKVRTNGKVVNRAAYVIIGVDMEGQKDVLGISIGENESSKFWLGVLTQLKNRGVKDVLIFCVDGLPGMEQAIEAMFPKSEIQRCIIHQLRYSFRYVSYKDYKEFVKDFKYVYKASTEEAALEELSKVKEKWGVKYPHAIKSWENNWTVLSPFFRYPEEIRRIMYTTNTIEALNRQYRKVTKSKSIFPTDTSLEKMLYLATKNIVKKWTQRYKNWDNILNQFAILYPERVTKYLY